MPVLQHFVECRNKRLCQPETEDQLRPCHEQLRRQTLEETGDPLILQHAADDLKPALGIFKIPILYSSLDYIERRGNDKGCRGSSDRSYKILEPGSGVIISKFVKLLLGEGGTTEKL